MIRLNLTDAQFKQLLMLCTTQDPQLYTVLDKILTQKLTKMLEHGLYSQYKTASTDEQKDRARQQYLDAKGIPEDFRY